METQPQHNYWRIIDIAAVLLLLAILWFDHDHRVREDAIFQQQKKELEAEISQQKAQADAAIKQVDANSAIIKDEISHRGATEQAITSLISKMTDLQASEKARLDAVESLGPQQMANDLKALIGVDPGAVSAIPQGDLRKIEQGLLKGQACGEQLGVASQQVTACQALDTANKDIIAKQADSITSLQTALKANQDAAVAKQEELEAQVKVVRGSLLHRALSHLKDVAIGVGIAVATRGIIH